MQPHAAVCPQCRSSLHEGALYCATCGFPLPPPQAKVPIYRRPGIMVVLLLFVVAITIMIPALILIVRELATNLPRTGRTESPTQTVTAADETTQADPSSLRGTGRVYFVPLGDVKAVSLSELAGHYKEKFGFSIEILRPAALGADAEDPQRKQVMAEDLIALMKRTYPALADDPQAFLIGISDRDMYIWHYSWGYALSLRQDNRFAVVSTARMNLSPDGKPTDGDRIPSRVRKMVTKNLALMYYGLEESDDWESALYDGIEIASELDDMREAFTVAEVQQAKHRQHPSKGRLLYEGTGDPCWNYVHVLRDTSQESGWQWMDACNSIDPQTTSAEAYSVDLRYGVLYTRRVDVRFSEPEGLPIRMQRICRNQDPVQRPFGMGCNHTYGAYLWSSGSLMSNVKLVLEDGTVEYRRTTPPVFFWPTEYVQTGSGGNFSGTRIEEKWPYRGWVLSRWDDTKYTFSDAGKLESIQDDQGNQIVLAIDAGKKDVTHIRSLPVTHGVQLNLDGTGRITRATADGGRELGYTYDEHGRLVLVRSPEGLLHYAYDGRGNLVKVSDGNDQTVFATRYDGKHRVIEQTLGDGRVYRFRYIENSKGDVAGADVVDEKGRGISIFLGAGNFRIYAIP